MFLAKTQDHHYRRHVKHEKTSLWTTAVNSTSYFSCSEHALIVAHHTAWLKNVLVRVTSSTWSSTLCGCLFLDSLFLTLFLSVCFSYFFFFFFHLNLELNLFLHVAVIGDNIPLELRQLRSLAPWPKTLLSQVSSPTCLTTSTTQRLLKSSSRGKSDKA